MDKILISDAQLKSELITHFESGITDKGKLWEVLGSKYKMRVQRFYKSFNLTLQEWANLRDKAQNEQVQANAVEGLQYGLKSKLELVLEVQKMLDDDEHEETFFDIFTKTEHKYHRKLTPLERKALYERISKFEGMDAPQKQEHKIESEGPIIVGWKKP